MAYRKPLARIVTMTIRSPVTQTSPFLLAAVAVLIALGGCEVATMYGIQLDSQADNGHWRVVSSDYFTLNMVPSNHPVTPGITLVARASERPAPTWDWNEFQTWPEEDRARVFGNFYDQVYLDLDVSHGFDCAVNIDHFDHRGDAQEVAYGRWLRELPKRNSLDEPLKGVAVVFPAEQCLEELESSGNNSGTLVVGVSNIHGEELDRLEIDFSIVVVETFIDWWF